MTRVRDTKKVFLASVIAISSTLAMVPATAGQRLASLTPGPTEPAALLAEKQPVEKTTENESSKKSDSSPTVVKDDTESWRAKPPTFPTPRPFKLPKFETYYLDNGLKVQLAEDHRFPYITSYIGFKSGSVHEPKEKLGLSELTADMVTEGTASLSSKEIAAEADFMGGNVKAIADYDFTIISGACLSNYTDRLFKLMTDVVLHPSFPENELKLKKTNLIQELAMRRSQPHFLLEERFRKVVFGGHPYAVVAPEPEMINSTSRDDLIAFHKAAYVPDNAILVVIGDFQTAHMKELIKDSFDKWEKKGPGPRNLPTVQETHGRKIYLVDRPGSVQSSIKVGNLGIKKTDPDYFNVTVMNQILGGGAHSRLFLNIREKKGYTYGAYSSSTSRVDPDSFAASADVRTEVTGPSIKEFIYELERIRDHEVTDEELRDAKNYLVGHFQLGLENQAGLAQRLLEVNLYNLPNDYLEKYSDSIMAVSIADVQKAAKKAIHSDDLVITVVGDAKKVKEELDSYGPIELYDASGKLNTTSGKTEKSPDS